MNGILLSVSAERGLETHGRGTIHGTSANRTPNLVTSLL